MVKKRLQRCAVRSLRPCAAGCRSGRSPGGFMSDWAPYNGGWPARANSGWIASTGLTGRTGRIGRHRRHPGLKDGSWSCVTS